MILRQAILNQIDCGNTASQIFKEFNLSYSELRKHLTLLEWNDIVKNTKHNVHSFELSDNCLKRDFLYDGIYYYIVIKKLGYAEISKILNVPTQYIRKVCRHLQILEQLFENNQRSKSVNASNKAKQLRLCQNSELINIYKDDIIDCLNSGMGLSQLKIKLNLPIGRINELIEMLNLTELRKNNSREIIRNNALKSSKKGAQKTKGTKIIRHVVTNEMKEFYCQCLNNGLFEGESLKLFKEKFGTKGSNTWNALINEFGQIKKAPKHFLSGEQNKMYGKEPDWKAGNGIKGHIFIKNKLINFRSSLELRIYLFLNENNIDFELSKHVVKYYYNHKWRNYFQDIIINNCIYEIKPTIKIKWEINRIKFDALQNYCKKFNLECAYITEDTFDLSNIDINLIDSLINDKLVIINEKEYKRLLKYSKKW